MTLLGTDISDVENSFPDIGVIEGKLKQSFKQHLVRERNAAIVKKKKQEAISANKLKCEVCKFSFIEKYGHEFIECHHIFPLNKPISNTHERETKLGDLALVCANRHRMLHRKFGDDFLTVKELENRMKSPG